MEQKYYIGTVGVEVIVDCKRSILGAVNYGIEVKKPDGTIVLWDAEIYEVGGKYNYLRYYTESGDLDLEGEYRTQAVLTLGSWTGSGATDYFQVHSRYS